MKIFDVLDTQPVTYLQDGKPVNGYLVRLRVYPWGEIVEINAPSLGEGDIMPQVTKWVEQRQALDVLGNVPDSET